MKSIWVLGIAIVSAGGCGQKPENAAQPSNTVPGVEQITFPAADGHVVYADLYKADKPNGKKVVLMFHQAGSNSGEYEKIAPEIKALGYDCITTDQRSGGDMYNPVNRTVKNSGAGDYMAAYADLQGALKYAQSQKYGVIIPWGSSYSAALTLRLASENKSISAAVVFSPGEYMDAKGVVTGWAKGVTLPAFFACTPDEWKDGRAAIFDAIPSSKKVKAVFDGGIHGSSTLLPAKSKAADQYMEAVKKFLEGPG